MEEAERKGARPERDHFLPKSKFPMFQMPFENLIPSCSICNGKIKRDTVSDTDKYLHPFQEEEAAIDFYVESGNRVKIRYTGTDEQIKKTKETSEFFKTLEIYGFFQDEIQDILEKKDIYTLDYMDELEAVIPKDKGKYDRKMLLKDILGDVEPGKVMNTSLGKLRRDLISVFLGNYGW